MTRPLSASSAELRREPVAGQVELETGAAADAVVDEHDDARVAEAGAGRPRPPTSSAPAARVLAPPQYHPTCFAARTPTGLPGTHGLSRRRATIRSGLRVGAVETADAIDEATVDRATHLHLHAERAGEDLADAVPLRERVRDPPGWSVLAVPPHPLEPLVDLQRRVALRDDQLADVPSGRVVRRRVGGVRHAHERRAR